jgi:hypothetical protein
LALLTHIRKGLPGKKHKPISNIRKLLGIKSLYHFTMVTSDPQTLDKAAMADQGKQSSLFVRSVIEEKVLKF